MPNITTKEAADIIGVCPQRVHQFVRQGRLRSVKVGRDLLFDRRQVEKFAKIKRPPGWRKGKKRAKSG